MNGFLGGLPTPTSWQSFFCHVERSRDISYYYPVKIRDSSTALGMTKKRICAVCDHTGVAPGDAYAYAP